VVAGLRTDPATAAERRRRVAEDPTAFSSRGGVLQAAGVGEARPGRSNAALPGLLTRLNRLTEATPIDAFTEPNSVAHSELVEILHQLASPHVATPGRPGAQCTGFTQPFFRPRGAQVAGEAPNAPRGRPTSETGGAARAGADGRTLHIDYRWGASNLESARAYAAQLVNLAPNVMLEMALNVKTAKALGLVVPQSILLRADEVIE
jgi:hypothetical protein